VANPFVQHETYDVEIVDPRDGEKWTVTLRTLNAGDDAALRDETVLETDESGVDRTRVPMGRLRMLSVQRAIVNWTLPSPPTAETIGMLHEEIFDQIYANVRFSEAVKVDASVPPTETPTDDSNRDEPVVVAS
jgi:hypothetical protein